MPFGSVRGVHFFCSDRLVGSPTQQFGFELASFIFHFSLSVGGKDKTRMNLGGLDSTQSVSNRLGFRRIGAGGSTSSGSWRMH